MTQKSEAGDASQLTDEQIDHLWLTRHSLHGGDLMLQLRDFARAVESAVLARAAVPAQPSGEAATDRDAGAMWDRFIAHLNECDSIEHVNLLGGVAKYRQAFIYAALSSTPTQGDDGNTGVPASDNWQQYAKAGETALACIERHRREQDGLMKLLAHARGEPLPDHEIIALLPAGWTGMLAQVMEFARRIERTRGVLASPNDQQEQPR